MMKDILLVDDDINQLHLLSKLLKAQGLDIAVASSAMKALDVLTTTTFRMVLIDFVMPEMNGIELAARVRRQYPGTEVVLLTGDNSWEFLDEAVGAGITTVLHKPVDLKRLMASITSSV